MRNTHADAHARLVHHRLPDALVLEVTIRVQYRALHVPEHEHRKNYQIQQKKRKQ